jgi:hypothetical protein
MKTVTMDEMIQIVDCLQTMYEQFWEIVKSDDTLRIQKFVGAKDKIHSILAGKLTERSDLMEKAGR